MNLDKLYELLGNCSASIRKGESVETQMRNAIKVIEIYDMPTAEQIDLNDFELVDMVFIDIAVHKEASTKIKDELIELLKKYPNQERLKGGPSYIELGAELGSQEVAFQLMAVGKVLKLWEIVTPYNFGIVDQEEAKKMAGGGAIWLVNYKG